MDADGGHKGIRLGEVLPMRALAIVLIVMYHSFIVYIGEWDRPAGFVQVGVYYWLAKFAISFSLELFTFISGYIFSMQQSRSPMPFGRFALKKLRRLFVPTLIFGVLYVILIDGISADKGVLDYVLRIGGGAGHLWYLPVLFVIFIVSYFLVKLDRRYVIAAFLLFLLATPFSHMMAYPAAFLMGFLVYGNMQRVDAVMTRPGYIAAASALFVALFIFYVSADGAEWTSRLNGELVKRVLRLAKIVASLCAVMAVYGVCKRCSSAGVPAPDAPSVPDVPFVSVAPSVSGQTPGRLVRLISENSFGIYIFHQFVLRLLLFRTAFPALVGPLWLPWLSLLIAFSLSLALTLLVRSFPAGRRLL